MLFEDGNPQFKPIRPIIVEIENKLNTIQYFFNLSIKDVFTNKKISTRYLNF